MIWVNLFGIGCIGTVCGYILFYTLKRLHSPSTGVPFPVGEVITLLTAVGAGGIIGGIYKAIDGVNYIGGYGIGLLLGFAINVVLTIRHEDPFGVWRRNLSRTANQDIDTIEHESATSHIHSKVR